MRARGAILTVLVALALAGTAASAHAAPANIIGGVAGPDPNLFSAPSYNHDAGTIATLTWAAGGSHDVAATATGPDGKPILDSDTIGSGATAVRGSQYLPLGTYPFICTIHFGMNSSLNVNAGAPLPRPTVAVKLASKGLDKVVKKGKANVQVTLTGSEPAAITLKLGKKVLGSKTAARGGTLVVPINAAGKKALGKKSKASLTIEATVDFGSPAKATGKLS